MVESDICNWVIETYAGGGDKITKVTPPRSIRIDHVISIVGAIICGVDHDPVELQSEE